jgi:hypothetical protein
MQRSQDFWKETKSLAASTAGMMKIDVEESISPCTEQACSDIKTSFENRIEALENAEMDQIWAKAFLAASLLGEAHR